MAWPSHHLQASTSWVYFHEAKSVEESPDVINNAALGDQQLAGAVIHDQIEVTLEVPGFLVLETVESRG
jgi:hypothetical protein